MEELQLKEMYKLTVKKGTEERCYIGRLSWDWDRRYYLIVAPGFEIKIKRNFISDKTYILEGLQRYHVK